MRDWPARRWVVAAVAAVVFTVAVAVPTVLIPNPWFSREIPAAWWAWPALAVSSVLAGLLLATYVRIPGTGAAVSPGGTDGAARRGWAGGLLTFFAVGCPVCNKIVLVAVGSAGAMTWFAPVQPYLQLAAIGLLAWGLRLRLRTERDCAVAVA